MKGLLVLALLQPAAGAERLGVAWHDATADAGWRQRVTAELAGATGVAGSDIERDVVARARWGIAYAASRDEAEAHAELAATMDAATAAYRGGDFEQAVARATAVHERLTQAAGTPGAARLAWRTQLLLAQVGHTTRDTAATDEALRQVVTLDPDAVLSPREVPPALIERHAEILAEVRRARWIRPRDRLAPGTSDADVVVEIDGRVDALVPPGRHFVVVRRPGHPPVAAYLDLPGDASVPDAPERIPVGPPRTRGAAEDVCAHAEVDAFVVVRRKGDRVGFERYACGAGFGTAAFVEVDALGLGLREALAAGGRSADGSRVARDPWPAPVADVLPGPEPPPTVDRKPWFRRAWVWAVVGTVVAGAVTTAVVLGTRDAGRRVRVDVPSFTDGD